MHDDVVSIMKKAGVKFTNYYTGKVGAEQAVDNLDLDW
jgi:hypothetical protein